MRSSIDLNGENLMDRYEIAIIGTGPAGLEAAITAKVRNKKILLIGNRELSSKVGKAHTIKNYLGLPEVSGEELQTSFKKHLEQMEIGITEDRIDMVYAMGDRFALQGRDTMYEADTVILACGMSAARPFHGELENLGNGVSYCATCDGFFYKEKAVIVIGYSKEEEKEANYLAELADQVTYIAMYEEIGALNGKIKCLQAEKPVGIAKNGDKLVLEMESGSLEADGIFILRENVAPSQLVPGLQIEENYVPVDRGMHTNIPGLFACGDITGAPYQYIKAAGEGNVAALSAVNYLTEIKR